MRKIIVIAVPLLFFSFSAYALSYSQFFGRPSEDELEEMSAILGEAVNKISSLETQVSDLQMAILELESKADDEILDLQTQALDYEIKVDKKLDDLEGEIIDIAVELSDLELRVLDLE